MARTVDADRLAAARQIMSMLRRSPSFRSAVPEHDSGDRPILIASFDDPLEEVIQRIHAIGLLVSHFWTQRAAAFRVPDPAANRDLFVQLA